MYAFGLAQKKEVKILSSLNGAEKIIRIRKLLVRKIERLFANMLSSMKNEEEERKES